eukprot:INCI3639.3.p1 GENE.INCI3639.3~~INCI3639.3.p1  ORF type:complete len:912 (+),score=90.74 INCI3639.3:179-2914(+)
MPPSDRTALAVAGFFQQRPLVKHLAVLHPEARGGSTYHKSSAANGITPANKSSSSSNNGSNNDGNWNSKDQKQQLCPQCLEGARAYYAGRFRASWSTLLKLRWVELLLLAVFVLWLLYATKRSFGMLLSEAFCRTRKDTGCDSMVFRYKMFCKYLGDPMHDILGLLMLPLTRSVSLLSLTISERSFPFDQILWVHRHLGALVVALACVHASGFFIDWTLESTLIGKLTPSFFLASQTDNRIFWGLVALFSLLGMYALASHAFRRYHYRLFYISHVVSAVLFFAGLLLHFHGGMRLMRRVAIPTGLMAADYIWRGYQTWFRCHGRTCCRHNQTRNHTEDSIALLSVSNSRPSIIAASLAPVIDCTFEIFGAKVIDNHTVEIHVRPFRNCPFPYASGESESTSTNTGQCDCEASNSFAWHAGQYVNICVPQFSRPEFHPFSIMPLPPAMKTAKAGLCLAGAFSILIETPKNGDGRWTKTAVQEVKRWVEELSSQQKLLRQQTTTQSVAVTVDGAAGGAAAGLPATASPRATTDGRGLSPANSSGSNSPVPKAQQPSPVSQNLFVHSPASSDRPRPASSGNCYNSQTASSPAVLRSDVEPQSVASCVWDQQCRLPCRIDGPFGALTLPVLPGVVASESSAGMAPPAPPISGNNLSQFAGVLLFGTGTGIAPLVAHLDSVSSAINRFEQMMETVPHDAQGGGRRPRTLLSPTRRAGAGFARPPAQALELLWVVRNLGLVEAMLPRICQSASRFYIRRQSGMPRCSETAEISRARSCPTASTGDSAKSVRSSQLLFSASTNSLRSRRRRRSASSPGSASGDGYSIRCTIYITDPVVWKQDHGSRVVHSPSPQATASRLRSNPLKDTFELCQRLCCFFGAPEAAEDFRIVAGRPNCHEVAANSTQRLLKRCGAGMKG